MEINIDPSILPLLAPMIMSLTEPENIEHNFPDCNHNTPNSNNVYEIMNNFCGSIMGVKNKHPQSLGLDGELLAMN